MQLDRLKVVEAVAGLGSLSKAAKQLGVAQSVVSRHVALLEAQWGDRLFSRTGRGVVLSDFGHRVLPQVRAVLAQAELLDEAVRDASGVASGVVRMGILPSISRIIVGALMERLHQRHPAVRLRITEGFSDALDQGLSEGSLDLAIINRYGPQAPHGEESFGRLQTFLVGRSDCAALAGRRTIPFVQLAKVPLALPGVPNGLRTVIEQIARTKRIKLDVAIEIDTISAIKDVVLQTRACTLLPLFAVASEVQAGTLAAAQVVQPELLRTVSIGTSRQQPPSRATRAVLHEIRGLLKHAMRAGQA